MTLLFLGFLAGVLYLAYDYFQNTTPPPPLTSVALPSPSPFFMTPIATEMAAPTPVQIAAAPLSRSYQSIDNASIFIPAAGINAPIIRVFLRDSTWDVTELGMNVGHLQGTNWIEDGQPGNIVLSGHVELRDGRAGIFAPIRDLSIGDVVFLRQAGAERRYIIREIYNVAPDDLAPLYPTETDILTLITCDNYSFSADAYEERTVIMAERIG